MRRRRRRRKAHLWGVGVMLREGRGYCGEGLLLRLVQVCRFWKRAFACLANISSIKGGAK
jgi:hypothetical protein